MVALMLIGALLLACSPTRPAAAQSTLEVRIKDHREAIEDFRALHVTIPGLAIHHAGAARDRGWLELQPIESRIDLTRYVGDRYFVLTQQPVPAGRYDGIRLTIERAEGVLKTGERVEVTVSLSPVALIFTARAEQPTVLLLDLVVVALSDEPGGGYELHIKEATVVNSGA